MKYVKRQPITGIYRATTIISLFLALYLLCGPSWTAAQSEIELRVTRLDPTHFPLLQLNLLISDGQSRPITDLDNLTLRENGTPIADLSVTTVPVGIDVIFVIDANAGYLLDDDEDGLTRHAKVQASISRFATNFMSPAGLDRVSIVVPDEAHRNGRFLVQNASDPATVINALEGYIPEQPRATPLNAMMETAIGHAASWSDNSRFRSLLLFSDAALIGQQLSFPTLAPFANDLNMPLSVAILGTRADETELSNAARLFQVTRGSYVHMPQSEATDPIYLAWQGQSNQVQVAYRSLQRQSGRFPITINLGAARTSTELDLTLLAPQITLQPATTQIQRAGAVYNSPLTELSPTELTLPLAVTWPDGLVRQITAVTMLVNGQPEITLSEPEMTNGYVNFQWDISNRDSGSYTLQARLNDEIGLSASSEPVTLRLTTIWPDPPTPTPIPTPAPTPELVPTGLPEAQLKLIGWFLSAGLIVLFSLILLWWRWRRHKRALAAQTEAETAVIPEEASAPADATADLIASLEILESGSSFVSQIPLPDVNTTLGRNPDHVHLAFEEATVSPLHARIKRKPDGYWLYDEGSTEGTLLNFERVGLTPQRLQDQDIIHLGRVKLRFHLRPGS